MDEAAIRRLKRDKQAFFLPYYESIVREHPEGIRTRDIKSKVRTRVLAEHGFDPFDGSIVGRNPTGAVRSEQWANNLISNQVPMDRVLVVTSGTRQVRLFPLTPSDTAVPQPAGRKRRRIDQAVADAASTRAPALVETAGGRSYTRSPALAEYVRQTSEYKCTARGKSCLLFQGRDGNPYIEVHHVIPMSEQSGTSFNLDCLSNMVALCPACHMRLHRADFAEAQRVLKDLLRTYEAVRKVSFSRCMEASGLGCDEQDLLAYYGVEA